MTGDDPRLGGLPFWQVIQEELAVTDHCISPLPSFLHARGLRDLQTNSDHVDPGSTGRDRQTLNIAQSVSTFSMTALAPQGVTALPTALPRVVDKPAGVLAQEAWA